MLSRFSLFALLTASLLACGGNQSSTDPAPIGNTGGDKTVPGGGEESCVSTLPASFEPATAADVLAAPQSYDGRDVVITGRLGQGPAMCTEMACSQANPCCNTCGSSMTIDGLDIDGLGCTGDSCNLECNGPDGANVQIWGTLSWDGYQLRLSKNDFCTM